MLVQIFGGAKQGKYPAVLLEDGQRQIVRSSTSSDADDVFSPGFLDVDVNCQDVAGSTSSLASELPSDGSTDSATPYDARSDLRCSDARSSTASRNGVDRQEKVSRERKRRVNRTCSDNQTQCSRQKRLVRVIRQQRF